MKILLPYDGSRNSLSALRLLASMALNPNSAIMILKVVPSTGSFLSLPGFDSDPVRNQEIIANHSRVLKELARELARWQRGCNISYRVHFGKPAESILDVADEWNAELIILGPRKPSRLSHFSLGSVSKEVFDKSHCPVMIVKQSDEYAVDRINNQGYKVLVPIDGSLYSYYTISWLASQVWKPGTQFKILTAIPEFKDAFESVESQYDSTLKEQWKMMKERAFESLEEHAIRLADQVGLDHVSIDVEPGAPKRTIEEVAVEWQPDIIAMGAPRPSGLNQMILGDVPTHVAGKANASILVVKRPGQGRPPKRDDSAMKRALNNVVDQPTEERVQAPHAVSI